MLAKGNSDVALCAANLIKTVRGEVPYERPKGISHEIIDSPSTAHALVTSDVERTLKIYEKRLGKFEVILSPTDGVAGHYGIKLAIS